MDGLRGRGARGGEAVATTLALSAIGENMFHFFSPTQVKAGEAPSGRTLLVHIAEREGVPIYGINYKDTREPALQWLELPGDPYAASGYDADGSVGLDLGVYGLPETFVVGPDGVIAHRPVGPITKSDWRDTLAPLIRSLQGG